MILSIIHLSGKIGHSRWLTCVVSLSCPSLSSAFPVNLGVGDIACESAFGAFVFACVSRVRLSDLGALSSVLALILRACFFDRVLNVPRRAFLVLHNSELKSWFDCAAFSVHSFRLLCLCYLHCCVLRVSLCAAGG